MNKLYSIFFFAMILVCNTALSQEREIDLETISMENSHDFSLQSGLMKDYLEISKEQIDQYRTFHKKYEQLSKSIIDSNHLSLEKREKLLGSLFQKRLKEFENSILTKIQRDRLQSFSYYESINDEGFTMSLVYGLVAYTYRFSGDERQRVYDSIPEIHEQYLTKVENAQRKAVQKILAKLPKNKRKAIKKRLNAMAGKKGLIWDMGNKHFTTKFGFEEYSHFKLSRIDEDE